METVFTLKKKKKKLIVVRLKSDEETEQSHKHTLKYVLYRKCLPAKNFLKENLSNQVDTL